MLDVAIGTLFFYLLLSLICSAVSELIEGFLKRRATNLARGIRELLDDPGGTDLAKKLYEHPLVYGLFRGPYTPAGRNLPSYIPARNFALALLDVILPASPVDAQPTVPDALRTAVGTVPSPRVRQALLTLLNAAGGDLPEFRKNMEDWYNSAMDRVAGWYKRWVQRVIFLLGLALAVALNADSLSIIRSLADDPPLRQSLVAAAHEYAKTLPPGVSDAVKPEERIKQNLEEIKKLGLPIGWNAGTRAVPPFGWIWAIKAVGWFITAVAISLGAPFWFDLLNKIMVVRSTVKPHEKSPEEASEDRRK